MQNIVREVEKSEKVYSGDPPQIKNPERSAKGHANPSCTTLEFWSKTHLDSRRSSAQTQLGNFAATYRTVKYRYEFSSNESTISVVYSFWKNEYICMFCRRFCKCSRFSSHSLFLDSQNLTESEYPRNSTTQRGSVDFLAKITTNIELYHTAASI